MNFAENTKYLELSQIIFLLGTSKDHQIKEKQKLVTLLFFLKNPIFLERLCGLYRPNRLNKLKIESFEKYNLLFNEERISLWNSKNDLHIAYLLSRELLNVELTDEGYSFKLSTKGKDLLNKLKRNKQLKIEYTRSKSLNIILGKKPFSEIKEIILKNFKELSL